MLFVFIRKSELESLREQNQELREELRDIRKHVERFPALEPCISEKCYSCENASIRYSGERKYPFLYGCMKNVKCPDHIPRYPLENAAIDKTRETRDINSAKKSIQ
ncbi:hypothetical protein [Dysosmobacter sp.]